MTTGYSEDNSCPYCSGLRFSWLSSSSLFLVGGGSWGDKRGKPVVHFHEKFVGICAVPILDNAQRVVSNISNPHAILQKILEGSQQ